MINQWYIIYNNRLCLTIWKCLTDFLRRETEKDSTALVSDSQEPRMLSEGKIVLPFISFVLLCINFKEKTKVYNFHNFSANCCNYLRLNSINDDTKSFWNAKLGLYKYHSLDKNGSVIYKHTTEEDTYLYRSPLGNWLVSFWHE